MIATRALSPVARALEYAGTHEWSDVCEAVSRGAMQRWGDDENVIITELRDTPLAKYLHFFLVEGHMAPIHAMIPGILSWAKQQGCTRASLCGREGWRRVPWLLKSGWKFKSVVMERSL